MEKPFQLAWLSGQAWGRERLGADRSPPLLALPRLWLAAGRQQSAHGGWPQLRGGSPLGHGRQRVSRMLMVRCMQPCVYIRHP